MKRWFVIPVLSTVLLLLMSGCNTVLGGVSIPTQPSAPAPSESAGPSPTTTVTPSPAASVIPERVVPRADMFGITGMDANVFDAAAEYSCKGPTGSLFLPQLAFYDTYIDGDTEVYLYRVIVNFYYFEEYSENNKTISLGGKSDVAAARIKDGNVISYEEAGDSDSYVDSIKRLCGPLTDLADEFIANEDTAPPFFTPGQGKMFQMYCDSIGLSVDSIDYYGNLMTYDEFITKH